MAYEGIPKKYVYGEGSNVQTIGGGWTEGGTPFQSFLRSDTSNIQQPSSIAAIPRRPSAISVSPNNQSRAMQWIPQGIKSTTTTSTRDIGDLPELPEYEELDEDKVKSRTQEFSALGRRVARSNFQDLLSRIYGANPDDPYAKNLARTASQGFSTDIQRAITQGGREALSAGLQEQQDRNQRRMTAYSAAVNAILSSATTTTTQEHEYAPIPMQALPTNLTPTMTQKALSTRYNYENPLSLGSPYTYG